MIKLNEKQKKALFEQTQTVIEQATEGKSTREIMATIYVDNLDSKTYEQGLMMADAVIDSVATFDTQYSDAKSDVDKWLDKALSDISENMSLSEKCTLWLKIATAVSMANDELKREGAFDNKNILNEIESLEISQEQATLELEKELYEKAKETIQNSNVMLSIIAEQGESLKNAENEDSVAGILLDFGSREIDFRAIASMIAYTNVKNGTFDNIPVDMRLEQLTTLVCTTVEEMRIADAVAKDEMDLDTAKTLLSLLGMISAICMIPPAICIGTLVVTSLVNGLFVLPAMGAMAVLMLIGIKKGYVWWNKETSELVEQCAVTIQSVRESLETIKHSIRETVVPKVSSIIKSIWDKISSMISRFKEKDKTEVNEDEEINEKEPEYVADFDWFND